MSPSSDTRPPREAPQNPLHERYASREMAAIFSAGNRFSTWRQLWVALAECQKELGLAITDEQVADLKRVEAEIDLERVAEIELRTRHDVVAHSRHFAELVATPLPDPPESQRRPSELSPLRQHSEIGHT